MIQLDQQHVYTEGVYTEEVYTEEVYAEEVYTEWVHAEGAHSGRLRASGAQGVMAMQPRATVSSL